MTDATRVDLLLKFALAAAGQEDYQNRRLGEIHLLKYVYLGDLAHAQRREGETFTGAPWRFHHFGPWTEEVYSRIAPVLSEVGAIEDRFESAKAQGDVVRWSLHDDDADRLLIQVEGPLPSEIYSAIKNAVHQFGSDTPTLLHYVYLTPPMLKAAPGEPLDFRVEREEVPPRAPVAAPRAMTVRERRQRKETLDTLRERLRRELAERRVSSELVPPNPPPRYDEVFAEGQRWLDELARIEPTEGTLTFSDAVWKSRGRRDPGIP